MLLKQCGLYLSLSHKQSLINEDNVFKPIKVKDTKDLPVKQNLQGFQKTHINVWGALPP